MNIHLVIIDPQGDFCQRANPSLAAEMLRFNNGESTPFIRFIESGGSLFVPGADEDCIRLAAMINRLENELDEIHVTLDSHQEIDQSHAVWWRKSDGTHPDPFTIISKEDVEQGRYVTSNPACLKRSLEYVQDLEDNKRFPLCIWPPHCIIGSLGYQVEGHVSDAINQWSKNSFKMIDFVPKGSNPWTEHYSAIKADVPDPTDPTTLINSRFVNTVDQADIILVAGQALSHCVNNTITDLIDEFGAESAKKIIILEDLCSNVPGFESVGDDFLVRARAAGVKVQNSTTVLT
jgi:nicotinamidase/pyrazinamidase